MSEVPEYSGVASSPDDPANAKRFEKPNKTWPVWAGYLFFLVVFTWAYVFLGAGLILRDDGDRQRIAGNRYIDAVYETAALSSRTSEEGEAVTTRFTSWLPQYTDGFIDPLWPWLVQGFADEPPEELLRKGRWLNLFLSCSLLVLLGIAAARAFSFSGAAAMILMGGFGIILERSTYFTPDALYNLFVLLAWLCGLSLTRQNQLWIYGLFGLLLGLIFLIRPPVWPLLTAFLAVSAIRTIVEMIRNRTGRDESRLWVNSNQMVGLAILATAFILVAGPRMSYSSARFGNAFHSYSHYSTWSDSSEDALRRFTEEGEESSLTWRERTGPVRFIEEKGFGELWKRSLDGAHSQLRTSALGRQGGIILYGFIVFLVIAILHRWTVWRSRDEVWKVRGTSARWMLLFLVSATALGLFYVGVGDPVVPFNSMTTTLFLPIMMTFIWIAERYRRQLQRSSLASVVNVVYASLMALPILWISYRVFLAVRAELLAA